MNTSLTPAPGLSRLRVLASVLGGWTAVSIAAQAPQVNRLEPSALPRGQRTPLTLLGERLGGASFLWTSFEAGTTLVPATGGTDRAVFQVDVPRGTPPGIGVVRLVTTNGVSGWSLLLIDDVPTVAASGTNRSQASAQPLNPPMAVDGVCDGLRSDYFRFDARKGQHLTVEVVANRIGSPLDPIARLLDATGRQLALAEDTPGAGADAAFSHRFISNGECYLELRDSTYEGGPRHRYRLRVGDFPPAVWSFLLNSSQFPRLQTPGSRAPVPEQEPNDTPDRALALTIPTVVSGAFAGPGDRDCYKFQVSKGQRVVVRGRTRSLGSPCDLFLRIEATNGAKVAEANVNGADEGTLTNTFDKAGEYWLRVEELDHRGGDGLEYHIAVETLKPGFALSVETDRVSGPPGTNIELLVSAERRDYDGPIALDVDGLPEEFTLAQTEIPARTNAVRLRIKVPADAELGRLLPFALTGRATVKGVEVAAGASTMPALRSQFPAMLWPPAPLDGWLTLGVTAGRSDGAEPRPRRRRN